MADFSQTPAGQTTTNLTVDKYGDLTAGGNGGTLAFGPPYLPVNGFTQTPAGQTAATLPIFAASSGGGGGGPFPATGQQWPRGV
jgi:hypothetical protein